MSDVTLVHGRTDNGRTTECEDRARILETEFAIFVLPKIGFGSSQIFVSQKIGFGSRKEVASVLDQTIVRPIFNPQAISRKRGLGRGFL